MSNPVVEALIARIRTMWDSSLSEKAPAEVNLTPGGSPEEDTILSVEYALQIMFFMVQNSIVWNVDENLGAQPQINIILTTHIPEVPDANQIYVIRNQTTGELTWHWPMLGT
ncbi:hypothetical protein [Prescottella equi]|uniref:hypothetical protein n=1 Tax=Rhodococcus hoagii TaxID=43767 RepID=UPI00111C9387|nr:hypothetical protein [Prescottella equi]